MKFRWQRGSEISRLVSIGEVTLQLARLLVGWVNVCWRVKFHSMYPVT